MCGQAEDFIVTFASSKQIAGGRKGTRRANGPEAEACDPGFVPGGLGRDDNGTYLAGSLGCLIVSMRGGHAPPASGRKEGPVGVRITDDA